MQIRRSACFRVLVMLHHFNFLQVDGRVLRENLHIVQNSGKWKCLALTKRHEAPNVFDPRFESIWRVILQTLHQLELFWRCLKKLRDETWHRCGWWIFYSHTHTHTQTQRMLFAVVHYCRNAAGKCLWTWCGTGRSHRKGGAGSGSFRSRSIDASRPSPGFSQDRCSFRIRSRNWARTPRTRIFAHFLHHDACWTYCFVEFSSWFYTSESILLYLLWFLVRMLEVIDYTECSGICIVVYCWVSTIRFSLLTSMISVNCHYIVSVPTAKCHFSDWFSAWRQKSGAQGCFSGESGEYDWLDGLTFLQPKLHEVPMSLPMLLLYRSPGWSVACKLASVTPACIRSGQFAWMV